MTTVVAIDCTNIDTYMSIATMKFDRVEPPSKTIPPPGEPSDMDQIREALGGMTDIHQQQLEVCVGDNK